MATYGSGTQLYVTGRRILDDMTVSTDIVYVVGSKTNDKGTRPVKGIPRPISKDNWKTANPLNRILDLKRDTETYIFSGFLISDSVSDDAWTKSTVIKGIFQYGGVITVVYRDRTITGAVTEFSIDDEAERSDLHISGTGYNLPEKMPISFTITVGVNI